MGLAIVKLHMWIVYMKAYANHMLGDASYGNYQPNKWMYKKRAWRKTSGIHASSHYKEVCNENDQRKNDMYVKMFWWKEAFCKVHMKNWLKWFQWTSGQRFMSEWVLGDGFLSIAGINGAIKLAMTGTNIGLVVLISSIVKLLILYS